MSIKITETIEENTSTEKIWQIWKIVPQDFDPETPASSQDRYIETVRGTEEQVKKYVDELDKKKKMGKYSGRENDGWNDYHWYREQKVKAL